jgi:hypothetical protein
VMDNFEYGGGLGQCGEAYRDNQDNHWKEYGSGGHWMNG